jgi:hypothetical protein
MDDEKMRIIDEIVNNPEVQEKVHAQLRKEFQCSDGTIDEILGSMPEGDNEPALYARYYELLQGYCDNA